MHNRAVYTTNHNRPSTKLHDINEATVAKRGTTRGLPTYCGEYLRHTARTTVTVLDPAPAEPPAGQEWCGSCSARSPRGRAAAGGSVCCGQPGCIGLCGAGHALVSGELGMRWTPNPAEAVHTGGAR